MSDWISNAKKIPLNPPFSKGEAPRLGSFPLFEKEGLGEISDNATRQRINP